MEWVIDSTTTNHVFKLILAAWLPIIKNLLEVESRRDSLAEIVPIVSEGKLPIVQVRVNFELVIDLLHRLSVSFLDSAK